MPTSVDIDTLSEEQLAAMLEMKKEQREAEEARRRAAEEARHHAAEEARRHATKELQRAEEEAKRKAEENNKLEERKKAEREKKKTGDDDRCTACSRTDIPCTFSAVGSKVCDRCRSAKRRCTFAIEAEKPKRRKRMDEVELPSVGGEGNKRSRRQLSPGELDVDLEEAGEKISVVAALEVLAEKLEQLTSVVAEGFALHRREQQRMIAALSSISEALENQEKASKVSEIEKDRSIDLDNHYKSSNIKYE